MRAAGEISRRAADTGVRAEIQNHCHGGAAAFAGGGAEWRFAMKTEGATMLPGKPREHGRPFWRIPRRFVISKPWDAGEWSRLDSAAQTLLPVAEIFGAGFQSHAGYGKLCLCCGSSATVSKGFKQLVESNVIERRRRRNFRNAEISCETRFAPRLIGNGTERFARFDNAVVTGGAWKELPPVARAVYVVLLCGVQYEAMKDWLKSASEGKDLFNKRKIVPTPREWLNASGKFNWLQFVAMMKNDEAARRLWLPQMPLVSLNRYDKGAIGIGTLELLSGRSRTAIKEAIPELERLNLALCLTPPDGSNDARRFILPPVVDWKHNPKFLDSLPPKRAWHETPDFPQPNDTPF